MSRLYFADPSDSTYNTIGFDFDGLATDGFGFEIRRQDWGEIDPDVTWHSDGSVAGAEQVRNHPGPVEATITVYGEFAELDYQYVLDTYRLLGRFLNSEGVLVWQPDGQDFRSLIDTYPSPIPPMWGGNAQEGKELVDRLRDQEYTFTVWRHPYPRRDSVTLLDAVTLSNALGDNVATFDNPGSALSEARLEIEVPGSEWVTQTRVGFRSGESTEFTTSLASYAITSPATVRDYWKTIHRKVITPTTPADFAGTYRVLAAMQLAGDIFHVALHHGATLDADQPLANVNEAIPLDASDISNFSPFVEVDLGLVTYDPESPSLVLEIHAYSEADTDMGDWGNVYLIPADEGAFLYASPGYRSGTYGLEVYQGALFALSGGATLDEDDDVILDVNLALAEVKPTAGQTLAVGPHVLNFRGSVHNRSRTRLQLASLVVMTNGAVTHSVPLWAKRGRPVTYYGQEFVRRIDFRVTDDTDVYRFYVQEATSTSALRWTKVALLAHHYVPVISDGRRLVVDAGTRKARIEDPDGDRVASLRATGLPYLQPGEGALALTLGEVTTHGYDHVDERMVLPKIDTATEALVTLTVTPRDLHP